MTPTSYQGIWLNLSLMGEICPTCRRHLFQNGMNHLPEESVRPGNLEPTEARVKLS